MDSFIPLNIAIVAPSEEAVPPRLYGGTERIVSFLVNDLITMGHKVTLFASADSVTSATLVPVWPNATRLEAPLWDPEAPTIRLLQMLADATEKEHFDVIHLHNGFIAAPMLKRLGLKHVVTLHLPMQQPETHLYRSLMSSTPVVSISDRQRIFDIPDANFVKTIYHGIAPLSFSSRDKGYLAFLGRIAPDKGPITAINIARRAQIPIRIAAKIAKGSEAYFELEVKPLFEEDGVEYIGEIMESQKSEFLGNAKALLFPIDWEEPFGMVMAESMMCGTPVIAFARGSVPEIIDEGVTGFVVGNEEEAVEAVGKLDTLDREKVRDVGVARFSSRRMTEEYVEVYKQL